MNTFLASGKGEGGYPTDFACTAEFFFLFTLSYVEYSYH